MSEKIRINLITNKNQKALILTDKRENALLNEITVFCKNKFKFKLKTVTDVNGNSFNELTEILNDTTLLVSDTNHVADISEKIKNSQPKKIDIKVIGEEFSNPGVFNSLEKIGKYEGVVDILALPDLSEAIPCPVGTSIRTIGKIYPSWIGTDIGCGISLFKINNKIGRIEKLVDKIRNYYTDKCDPIMAAELRRTEFPDVIDDFDLRNFDSEFASIGQGNHFCEIQNKTDTDEYYICVHSGSRSLGVEINKRLGTETSDSEQINRFLKIQEIGIRWAKLNRLAIAKRVINLISDQEIELVVDVCHNFISIEDNYYIHRKGAIPSNKGPVMIPGSRGTNSYLVQGTGLINSLPHGAGRKCSKTDAGQKYFKLRLQEDTVICNDKTMLSQEYPGAYKDIDSIIKYLVEGQMITVLDIFSPLLTLKYTGN